MENMVVKLAYSLADIETVRTGFSLVIFFTIYRGIPGAIKWWSGDRKRDSLEKNKTRDSVQGIETTLQHDVLPSLKTIQIDVKAQGSRLQEINGSFKSHCANGTVHTPRAELLSDPLLLERNFGLEKEIATLTRRYEETVVQIFDRLNVLAGAK
jgi:hypothetical protein